MATTIIENAVAYSSQVVREPLNQMAYAPLVKPEIFQYSKFGKDTMVREITAGTASDYDVHTGFEANGTGGSAKWVAYTAPYDRGITFAVDAIQEYNAIEAGMELSSAAVAKQNLVAMAAEIDATTTAALFANVPEANVLASTVAKVDKDNVISTLDDIEGRIFNAGYSGDSYVFTRNAVYTAIKAAIVEKHGLANEEVLKYSPVVGLELETRVLKYNNLYFIRVADNRMYSAITLLDGKSEGQTAGGYIKADGASYVDMLVVPVPAAALSLRHFVANLLVPMAFTNGLNMGEVKEQLGGVNDLTGGAVAFANVGVNQKADSFEYQTRMIYGAMAFNVWKKTLFAVTTAIA